MKDLTLEQATTKKSRQDIQHLSLMLSENHLQPTQPEHAQVVQTSCHV